MTKKTTLYFPDWLHQKIKMKSVQEDISMTDLIIEATKKYYNLQKEEDKITKQEITQELKGNTVVVDAEWLEENDPEMLDWVTSSDYWGRGFDFVPERNQAIVKIEFDENGVRFYSTFQNHPQGVKQSLNNQPAWGEDNWEDWDDIEALKAYYNQYN
jgi:hypothetical protein